MADGDLLASLGDGDRPDLDQPIAVVVAHPDDEVIGLGAQLPRLRNLHLIHVTDGAPRNPIFAQEAGFSSREDYARARREELDKALSVAAISPRVDVIGVPDQEASQSISEIAGSLARHFRATRPASVITHPYEGGHPDHDAVALAVRAACRLVEAEGGRPPEVYEMTSYHNRGGEIQTGEFLPSPGRPRPVLTVVLTEWERLLKRRLFDCFPSQRAPLDWFPIGLERFRVAPDYDFTAPPHEGQLFYEMFDWGMTGPQWRDLARDALAALPAWEKLLC